MNDCHFSEPKEWNAKKFPVYLRQKDTHYVKRNFNVLNRHTLLNKSIEILNKNVLPKCWYWSVDDVLDWLKDVIKLPQYKEAFKLNGMTGRKLIVLNSKALVKMNIKDYDHIKEILSGIRSLYGLLPEKHPRNLTLPRLHFVHHFYIAKSKTGTYYDNLTYDEYMESSKLEHPLIPDYCYILKHAMDNAWQLPFLLARTYPLYKPERIFLKNQDIRGPPPLDKVKYNTLGKLCW